MRVESSNTALPLVPDGTTLSFHWYQMAPHCHSTGTRWHLNALPLVLDGTRLFSNWYQMAPHCPPNGTRWHHTVLPLVPHSTILSSHWYGIIILTGGLMLNGVVLGLLMKPVPMKPSLEPPDIMTSTAQSPAGPFLRLIYTEATRKRT